MTEKYPKKLWLEKFECLIMFMHHKIFVCYLLARTFTHTPVANPAWGARAVRTV